MLEVYVLGYQVTAACFGGAEVQRARGEVSRRFISSGNGDCKSPVRRPLRYARPESSNRKQPRKRLRRWWCLPARALPLVDGVDTKLKPHREPGKLNWPNFVPAASNPGRNRAVGRTTPGSDQAFADVEPSRERSAQELSTVAAQSRPGPSLRLRDAFPPPRQSVFSK